MIKISVITLGCKVNQYDSDAMLAVFKKSGMEIAEGLEFADLYVINTCAVTQEAERKSRQYVGKILKVNPNAKIYVCGCASQNNFSQFAKDNVLYISGTNSKVELAKHIVNSEVNNIPCFDKIVSEDFSIDTKFEEATEGIVNLKTRHFIKIQDGCNNFCSYCLIPYLRGRSRSRSLISILDELDYVQGNVNEVVLTGINLSAYGQDINITLEDLLIALSTYDFRVRLGSLEVNVIDEAFLEATKKLKHFCPQFHLSLQSGDDSVLRDMNRHYTTDKYFEACELIRKYYPDAGITTDIIVGFPTESEEQFVNSMNFAKKVAFSDIHVFPYSSRKGTNAAKFKVLPGNILDDRQHRMLDVKYELRKNFLLSQIGKPQEVLFETKEDGMWVGHTPNFIKVYSTYGSHNKIDKIIPTMLFNDGLRV